MKEITKDLINQINESISLMSDTFIVESRFTDDESYVTVIKTKKCFFVIYMTEETILQDTQQPLKILRMSSHIPFEKVMSFSESFIDTYCKLCKESGKYISEYATNFSPIDISYLVSRA